MYYFVIGEDGQRYGPADVDTLVRWVAEGRIVASTWLVERGTDQQVPADALPAVSAALRRASNQPAPVTIERNDAPTATQPARREPRPPGAAGMAPSPGAPAGASSRPGLAPGPGMPPVPPVPVAMPGPPGAFPGRPQTVGYARTGTVGPKSKLAAGLLGIFLGGLGIHRFYLGYTGIGLLMLLLSLAGGASFFICLPGVGCGIVWLWGLIEGIVCLCGGMRDADGMELRD